MLATISANGSMTIFLRLCAAVLCSLLFLSGCSAESGDADPSTDSSGRDTLIPSSPSVPRSEDSATVTLFMVEQAEEPHADGTFGCGDRLVGKRHRVARGGNLPGEAIRALIAPENDGPGNYVAGENIRLDSAVVENGIARIYLEGNFLLGGVCDHPRIEEQLRATAAQFPEVDSVLVYVGTETLREYLSLR